MDGQGEGKLVRFSTSSVEQRCNQHHLVTSTAKVTALRTVEASLSEQVPAALGLGAAPESLNQPRLPQCLVSAPIKLAATVVAVLLTGACGLAGGVSPWQFQPCKIWEKALGIVDAVHPPHESETNSGQF